VADKVKKDVRVIKRYLDGLCEIFALIKVHPHESGVGKERYLFPDSGIASFLGASTKSILESHVLNEALSAFEATGRGRPQVFFYRSAKKSYIPFVFEWLGNWPSTVVQISDAESISRGEMASVESFLNRNPKQEYRVLFLFHGMESYQEKKFEFYSVRS
jgi:hypothetical protein